MNTDVLNYNDAQTAEDKIICNALASEICKICPMQEIKYGMRTLFGF